MKKFFTNPTQHNFQECHKRCTRALDTAIQQYGQNKDWYQVNPIIRNILGILAAMTMLPALIIQATSKHGYIHTFFAKPATEDSKLAEFKKQFEEQKSKFETYKDLDEKKWNDRTKPFSFSDNSPPQYKEGCINHIKSLSLR
jgi:hypothetical protein